MAEGVFDGTFGTDRLGMIFSGMDGDLTFIRARVISLGAMSSPMLR